jgi:PhnB protein
MLQGADVPPESYQTPQGFSLSLDLQDAGKGERIFEALAQNGTVKLPLQETSWAQRFGILVDRFGVPWLINVGKHTCA